MTIDKQRYIRQISLEEVGERGQELLASTSVLVVGVGGLGSTISMLLASSGVGHIGLVEFDVVSMSNLPRQILYSQPDLGRSKLECAEQRLRAMNSQVTITGYNMRLDESSAESIIDQYDMVVDAVDNAESRYVIDSVCAKLHKPYIYGAINGFVGQVSIFHYRGAGGYSDLYPRESVDESVSPPPVMSTTPAIIGAIEANEVLKIAIGYGEVLSGKLLTLDLRDYSIQIFSI